MVVVLQILFVLGFLILLILFVFQPRRAGGTAVPANFRELLTDYVGVYAALDAEGKKRFEEKFRKFLGSVIITGANAEIEDLDRVLIGAAAVIPVAAIPDWDYVNLREVIVYPGHFNSDYDQYGHDRNIAGMVGNGPLENVMILSKWEVRQGFINGSGQRNTAVHEFVHLIDKMDGTLDGVPELLLERKFVAQWRHLLEETMDRIRRGQSDVDPYGATSPVECFAVLAEYFFTQPEAFREAHPELHQFLVRIFVRR